jgi:hypothetical protein
LRLTLPLLAAPRVFFSFPTPLIVFFTPLFFVVPPPPAAFVVLPFARTYNNYRNPKSVVFISKQSTLHTHQEQNKSNIQTNLSDIAQI